MFVYEGSGEWEAQEVKQSAFQLQSEHREQQQYTRAHAWVLRQWRQAQHIIKLIEIKDEHDDLIIHFQAFFTDHLLLIVIFIVLVVDVVLLL